MSLEGILLTLKNFSFTQFQSFTRSRWILEEVSLNELNLIVGLNSAGKSRSLAVIRALSELFIDRGV